MLYHLSLYYTIKFGQATMNHKSTMVTLTFKTGRVQTLVRNTSTVYSVNVSCDGDENQLQVPVEAGMLIVAVDLTLVVVVAVVGAAAAVLYLVVVQIVVAPDHLELGLSHYAVTEMKTLCAR